MSIQHDIKIFIMADFNENNISNILQKGTKLGFVYFDFIHMIENNLDTKILDHNDALKLILYPKHDYLNEYGRILFVKYNDVCFDMFFYNLENNQLKILLGNFCNDWKQDFFGSGTSRYEVKYQQFIKTALFLCNDFCIKKIETEAL